MYHGERFNGWSHLAAALLAAAGVSLLLALAAPAMDAWRITGVAIYGATLLILFVTSTLYHSTRGRAKAVLRKLDHCAIYLLIAGTYTPFALVTLRGAWGWSLLGVAWGLALLGIGQEFVLGKGTRPVSLGIYLVMGWMGLVALQPLAQGLGAEGLAWVIAGGVIYTAGIVFYALDERIRHFHGIWHLFVLAGSAAHFTAIARHVA
ncbi:MAG TPA: hemolysin III family protein [Myxococcota bacterium]|nr:hemolysin III family protein [Myxococcota bacterium]